jgi:hypothetical protein
MKKTLKTGIDKRNGIEYRKIAIAIEPDSEYHERTGTGSLIDLIQERSTGEDTGIRVLEIE